MSQAQTADTLFRAAQNSYEAGDLQNAEAYGQALVHSYPGDPNGWLLLGMLALKVKNNHAAIGLIEHARSISPDDIDVATKLGLAYSRCGLYSKAEALYVEAVMLNPGHPEVLENYADLCAQLGRTDKAEELYRDAIKALPESPPGNAMFHLARILQGRGDFREAEVWYRRVLEIAPNFLAAHNNISNTLKSMGRLTEAEHHIRRALELDPNYALGYNNLGAILSDQGRPSESLESYQHALRIEPKHPMANPNYLLAMHYGSELSATEIWEAHRTWNKRIAAPLNGFEQSLPASNDIHIPLKVGFVSPDLRHHPVGIFLLALVAAMDHGAIETIAYSTNSIDDEITARLRETFCKWRNIAKLDDESAADQIRMDGLDILIDLSGHSAGGRLLLFARKPAPIQVTWLGYPDTTGLDVMDFRLTDALADPPGAEQFHSEQLVRMPHGFLCFNPPSEAPPPLHPPILTTAGAPTFGCFNNYAKITPEMLAVWAQILHRLPEARLMIKNKGLQCTGLQERLHHQFHQLGVKAERIILVPQVKSYTEHLDLYNQVDVALDTSPYNGTTTTCEALWMGVPVVTLRGDRHSARVGASILSRVGLDRLVAETTDRYVSIAVDLAIQTDVLGQYRKSLRETMRSIPLGNPPMFARTFEKTLLQLSQAQSV